MTSAEQRLRDVVDEFREWAEQYGDDYSSISELQKSTAADYHRCADELEQALDECSFDTDTDRQEGDR